MQENAFSATDQRLITETVVPLPGIVQGFNIVATAPASMNVTIGAGRAIIEKTDASNQGSYVITNDGNITATIGAASTANPRIDRIVLTARDSQFSGSNNDVIVQVIAGTVAASPVAPAAPANSITLGLVTVPKSATTITTANIDVISSDQARASYTLAPQITKCLSTKRPTTNLVEGMLIQETDTGYIRVRTGGVWKLISSGLSTTKISDIAVAKGIPVNTKLPGYITYSTTFATLVAEVHGNPAFTPLSGSALIRGGMVQVNISVKSLVNIVKPTNGNITNLPLCSIKDPYKPAVTTPVVPLTTGPTFGAYANADGSVYLANLLGSVSAGDTFNFSYVAGTSSKLWAVS